jgi:hypothetical protein
MVPFLALSDSAILTMQGVQITVSVLLGVGLFLLGRALKKLDRKEDADQAEKQLLRRELHATAEKLIDERFRGLSHEMASSVNGFKLTLDSLRERLNQSSGDVQELIEDDHALEIKVQTCVAELEKNILKNFATKEDLEKVEDTVRGLHRLITVDLVARIERASAAMEQAATTNRAVAERITGRSVK